MLARHPISDCDLRVRHLVVCPVCRGDLDDVPQGLACGACERVYPVEQGVPILLPERSRRIAVDRAGHGR